MLEFCDFIPTLRSDKRKENIMWNHIQTSALEVAEIAKKREAEERIKMLKEQEQKQYAEEMRAIAKNALDVAKIGNEIAKESKEIAQNGLNVANTSKKLSLWTVVIAIAAMLVSVVLHFID